MYFCESPFVTLVCSLMPYMYHVPLPLAEMMCMSDNDDATNAGAANDGVCVDHV